MSKKSIGILYICTEQYCVFWEDFHKTFDEKFLPDTTKNYYVFTNKPETIPECERVKVFYIDHQPWPLITLLRFHYFLKFRHEIENNDYLMFANSNLRCQQIITEDEFLPDEHQELTSVLHPAFYETKSRYLNYERDRKSTAYIPYNAAGRYMMGCLYCGHTDKFMKMSEILAARINKDFANRKIALWHDESQCNKYIFLNDIIYEEVSGMTRTEGKIGCRLKGCAPSIGLMPNRRCLLF